MSENEFELYLELLGKFLRLRPGQRADIADELRDHMEARFAELCRTGMSRSDAVRRAVDEFGDAACLADHFTQLSRQRTRRILMRCTLGTVCAAAGVLIVVTAFGPQQPGHPLAAPSAVARDEAPAEKDKPTTPDDDPDARVRKILEEKRLTLNFTDTPASDVLTFFGEELGVDVVPSKDARDQLTNPITLSVKNTQLTGRAALQLTLDQIGLNYLIQDGLIHIRQPHAALVIEIFDVRSLVALDDEAIHPNEPRAEAIMWQGSRLIETIERVIRPDSWIEQGGAGRSFYFNEMLIVRQTPDVIDEVDRFLETMRVQLAARETQRRVANRTANP